MSLNRTEITDRRNLLMPNGMLAGEGWSRSGMFVFSRASVPLVSRLTRLKEWCSVCLGNEEMCLSISIVDGGYAGVLLADYVNLTTETVRSAYRLIPFSFGRLELPGVPDSGDVLVRMQDASFDLLNSSTGLIVRCQFNAFDDVRPLYVNVTLSEQIHGGIYSAQKVGKGFAYEHGRVYSQAVGTVHFGADETRLSSGFGWTDCRRSVLPYRSERRALTISGVTDTGKSIAFSLGQGYCEHNSDVRNCASLDGELIKLGRVTLSEDGKNCSIISADKHIDLKFSAKAVCPHRLGVKGVLELGRRLRFGRCSGTARLGDRYVSIKDAHCVIADESCRW